MLDEYAELFPDLRTDRGGHCYHELTRPRAPHKPFRFPSVMDLITFGRLLIPLPLLDYVKRGIGAQNPGCKGERGKGRD